MASLGNEISVFLCSQSNCDEVAQSFNSGIPVAFVERNDFSIEVSNHP